MIIIAVFVRSRSKEGIGTFEITKKDKAQIHEVRRELGFRRILGRLLGGFGSLAFVAGILSLVQDQAHWGVGMELIAISLFLVLCTVLLLRNTK